MENQPNHRLQEARIRAGVTLRALSSRTGIPLRRLQRQEASNDVSLNDLLRWQEALGVPLAELVDGPNDELAEMNRVRAGLVKIMRSVRSLQQTKLSEPQEAFVENLQTTLQTLMPELDAVRSWPVYGERRSTRSLPRIESNVISTAVWCPEIQDN